MTGPVVPTPAPPEWVADLANRLAGRIDPIDELADIGCHFADGGDCWEVTLFVTAGEQIGGPHDGSRVFHRFLFDLADAGAVFERIDRFYWQPLRIGDGDEAGPHLAIEGVYDGRAVWVRILAEPGERFDPL